MKGNITKQFILALESWLCPWCFIPLPPRPGSHIDSPKNELLIVDEPIISSNDLQKLSDSIIKTVTQKIENIELNLSNYNQNVLELKEMSNKLCHHQINYSQNNVPSKPSQLAPNVNEPLPHTTNNSHSEAYIDEDKEKFLDAESCATLKDYFENCEFTPENGRSVISFGEHYRYNGSKSQPCQLPEIINSVIDKINNNFDLKGDTKVNSCLVNQFSGPGSYLNEHSDDEMNIHPESNIFTISLGEARTITFREMSSGSKFEHKPPSGSLYTMTRKSQNYFKHQICQDEQFHGIRYSLRFRAVHWRYGNSTCIVGDSNTKNLMFGSERGTFGVATPGEKFFTPTVEKINPHNCVGYNNVVIMCGINDIKIDSVRSQSDIRIIFNLLKSKIDNISKLNPRAKIFICPIIPTKLRELNKKALFLNHLIFSDLVMCDFGVSVVHGFDEFVDPADGLLSRNLSRPHMHDALHLNSNGTKSLAEKIKTSIFQRKKGGSRTNSDRNYAEVVQQGLRPP